MNKFLLLLLQVASSQLSFTQINDIAIDSMFNRFNVGEYYVNGIEYFRLPQDQLRPLNCSAQISNVGTNDITNCHLRVDVKNGGTIIFTEYSDSILVAVGGQDSLYLNTTFDFSSQPLGMYNIVYTIDSDSTDINIADNSDSLFFEITQNQLSRSDFVINDSTKNYFQDSLSGFGYVFKVENDACLSAVYPWMSYHPVNPSLGIGGVTATLFELDSILGEYNLKATSYIEQIVDSSSMGSTIEIPFYNGNDLLAGNTYLVTVNSPFHDFYLCQNSIDSTIYYSYPSGIPGSFYNDQNAPLNATKIIKMDIAFNGGPYCNLSSETEEFENLSLFPNPNQGTFQVNLPIEIEESGEIQIYSMNGQLVYKEVVHSQSIFYIDIHNIPTGFYSLHFICDKGRFTEKLILQK